MTKIYQSCRTSDSDLAWSWMKKVSRFSEGFGKEIERKNEGEKVHAPFAWEVYVVREAAAASWKVASYASHQSG